MAEVGHRSTVECKTAGEEFRRRSTRGVMLRRMSNQLGPRQRHSDETVRRTYEEAGGNVAETAAALGYNTFTVYMRLRKMGVPSQGHGRGRDFKKKYSDEQVKQAWEDGGHDLQRTAQLLGSTVGLVRSRAARLNLPDAPQPRSHGPRGQRVQVEWVVPERTKELRLLEIALRRFNIDPPEAMLKDLEDVPPLPQMTRKGPNEVVIHLGEGRNLRVLVSD